VAEAAPAITVSKTTARSRLGLITLSCPSMTERLGLERAD
jgi:hypothetical protein